MTDILVPIDGSPLSYSALEYALEHFPDDSVTTLYVIDPVEAAYPANVETVPMGEEWYESAKERADGIHDRAREIAAEYDAELTTLTEVDRPRHAIISYVEEHDPEGIVMGSHGRDGIERLLLGSVAESVMRRSEVPVTVVR
ncbi:universal stress protein [Halostella salina]|uniref:universal stress protein n=1 Tax=Halostella salina TaxID=1547897 RepID=UPI000EF84261|nr:universal stress protein [Halostella salina]